MWTSTDPARPFVRSACVLFGLTIASFALAATALAHDREAHRSEPAANAAPGAVEAHPMQGDAALAPAPHETHGHGTPEPHAYPPPGVPRPLAWLGKFHPMATHFPIALLMAAAFAELWLTRGANPLLENAVRFCVWGGAAGALAAALLGWLFAGVGIIDDEWVMTAHRWVGTATALFGVVVFKLSEAAATPGASRGRLRIALFGSAALVGIAGFLGGSLVYGLDHYAW